MTERIYVGEMEVHLEGSGDETVVMIHGWPDNHTLWDPQVEMLKGHFRCARFTLPGYDPNHVRKLHDVDDLVLQISRVVDAVSPDKPVTLLIHDWGSVWGYQYYLRNQDRVKRIVSVDIGDAGSKHHELSTKAKLFIFGYQMWLATAWKIGGNLGDRMTRYMAGVVKAPGAPETIHSGMTYSYFWKWHSTFTGKPLNMLPLKVECPLLFIYGADKKASFHSEHWQQQMAEIPGNRVEGLPTGHWVMRDEPEQFNRIVFEWLTKPVN
ncbi:alpha/beta fold hydrolase [Ferrimonas aestuarii]|uniref:Alpha/beta hydrolase n=1 Tax=Ferrimonas aestuarii TaxID=2569539 RepID=A0A4U1BTJ1_9GAMM|nr:alpha/beta hydrolase [Ferrimonas aestuarii]TKB57258.1 alpha/beta hydrolase [Ferrimonas aestuarii]